MNHYFNEFYEDTAYMRSSRLSMICWVFLEEGLGVGGGAQAVGWRNHRRERVCVCELNSLLSQIYVTLGYIGDHVLCAILIPIPFL